MTLYILACVCDNVMTYFVTALQFYIMDISKQSPFLRAEHVHLAPTIRVFVFCLLLHRLDLEVTNA